MHSRRMGLLTLILLFGFTAAWAQSSLHMGTGAGTPCATGCGGHPNLFVGAKTVDIYQASNGAFLSNQPVLLIFGVPTDFSNLFPLEPVKGVRAINPYPGGTRPTAPLTSPQAARMG